MCLVPGLFLGLQDGSAQAVANGGFETGTFVSAGSFAGGTYMAFGNPPTSWSDAGGVSANYKWVNSVAAHGGTKYAYSTSSGNVNANSDSCFQANITGLTAGNCYTISVWAAEAGGSVNNPNRNPCFMTLEFQHDAISAESFEYGRFILPNNPAWSDTALTAIPWAQYSYTFTASTRDAANGMILWVSSNGTTAGGTTYTTYLVADDVTIAVANCSTITYDYGDLPVTGTTFNTDGANAPRHQLVPGVSLRLGSTIDGESNGRPTAFANGDDNTGGNDEDGVTFPTFTAGSAATVVVNVVGSGGKLNAWIDWNGDGTFGAGEQIASNVAMNGSSSLQSPTANNLSVTPPAGAVKGQLLAARFRLSSAGNDAATSGTAANGEIEDYMVMVSGGTDWGDLPDNGSATVAGSYATLSARNGPRHTLSNTLMLGTTVDAEADGQQSASANGDDTAGIDDEDGVNFSGVTFIKGLTATLPVTVSKMGGGTAKLNAFFDFNNNGVLNDSGEAMAEVTVNIPITGSVVVNLAVPVPTGATTGANLGARFRISTAGGLGPTSTTAAADGEVEDYLFTVTAPTMRLGNRVWKDDGAGAGGTANDGIINGTEVGINGVAVLLYNVDSNGFPVGYALGTNTTATFTSKLGYYSFDVVPGNYVVVIPASNFASGQPLLNLYSSGTSTGTSNGVTAGNTTDSIDNGYNSLIPANNGVRSGTVTMTLNGAPTTESGDLGPGNGSFADNNVNFTVDFGFVASAATAVKLGYVKGWWLDGQVTVEWETVSELNTLGFDLYRMDLGGSQRVNAHLIPALNVEKGGVYHFSEPLPRLTAPLSYILVEQETTGGRREYGPFQILVQTAAAVTSASYVGGVLELRLAGDPGVTYQVESTDDLVHGRWTQAGQATADANGVILCYEPLSSSGGARFYRALRP